MKTSPTRRLVPLVASGACAFLMLTVAALGAKPQTPATAAVPDSSLAISGDVLHPLTLTAAELKAMPRTTVTIVDQGRDVKYTGVLVGEVLARAGAPIGRELSGAAVATYVLASAKDGYQAVFSLAELDPAFTPNDIIIADTVDGQPLFDYQGPFRIVAPKDKRGARSVRMLQRLEVVRLKK
jgi:DMSO/TMAO reductase YedYZ molybdopterin-dependent catalytic subunit